MDLTDEELLDFDTKQEQESGGGHNLLAGLERAPRSLLKEHGDVYRAQLVAARHIEGWAKRQEEQRESPTTVDPTYNDGFVYALREITAHLRQGSYLPGGILHDETLAGKLD